MSDNTSSKSFAAASGVSAAGTLSGLSYGHLKRKELGKRFKGIAAKAGPYMSAGAARGTDAQSSRAGRFLGIVGKVGNADSKITKRMKIGGKIGAAAVASTALASMLSKQASNGNPYLEKIAQMKEWS